VERMKFVGRVYKLRYKLALGFLDLATRNPKDPIALARLDPGGLAGTQHPLAGRVGGIGPRGGEGLCDPRARPCPPRKKGAGVFYAKHPSGRSAGQGPFQILGDAVLRPKRNGADLLLNLIQSLPG